MAGWSHTYFPKSGAFVAGEQEAYVHGMPVMAIAKQGAPETDANGGFAKAGKWTTSNLSASVQKATRFIQKLKQQYGNNLGAADENITGDFLAPLIQLRLHEQIMGEQQRWFHLANAFNTIQVDKLLYRMPFQDSPAAAQKVAAREQYDVNKVTYHEQFLELEKAVNSYDIAWEDKLRATIDFEPSLSANLNFSIDYLREVDAIEEIKKLGTDGATEGTATKGYYNVSTGAFVNTQPSAAAAKLQPQKIGTNTHSDQRSVDAVMDSMNLFTEENDMFIDTVVASPKTIMRIAANTWTENNTIFNVEAYRTNGGVRPFPGIPGVQAVMSLLVPDDSLYCFAKNMNTFVLAEGPKQLKMWDDPTRFRKIHAQADFYKHKYMLTDIKYDDIKRRFGYIIGVDYTA